MRKLLLKEFRLSASPLSFLFIAFGLMFLLPGYPVLCGAFFVTLGIFQSFQNTRETNDILYSALLPIAKRDVVRGKYFFVCFIELCALVVMAAATALRMTVWADIPAYANNALMTANPYALGMACLIFGLFNRIFVGGFFKTAYKFGRPFIAYIIVCMLVIFLAEALHYFPGLEALNAFGTERLPLQLLCLGTGAMLFALLTVLSCRTACKRFERIDL